MATTVCLRRIRPSLVALSFVCGAPFVSKNKKKSQCLAAKTLFLNKNGIVKPLAPWLGLIATSSLTVTENSSSAPTSRHPQSLVDKAVGEIHYVIKNGYPPNIPVLDPLVLPTFSVDNIQLKHSTIKLTVNDPVLYGLDTVKTVQHPEVDLRSMSADLILHFERLTLSSKDVDEETIYSTHLRQHELEIVSSVSVQCSDVTAEIKLSLMFSSKDMFVLKMDACEIKIGSVDIDIEDAGILDKLLPRFQDRITAAINSALQSILERKL